MAQYKIQPRVLENEAGEAKSAEHGCHCADLLASLEVLVILVERDHSDQHLIGCEICDALEDARAAIKAASACLCGHADRPDCSSIRTEGTGEQTMNEEELPCLCEGRQVNRLHDGEIRNVRRSGNRVVVDLDFVDRWEPQEEEGHYRLVYIPAHLIFEDAEIVTQTGDYACLCDARRQAHLDELPDFHHARTILWVDVMGGPSTGSGRRVYHFATPGDGSLAIRAASVRLERLAESEVSDGA